MKNLYEVGGISKQALHQYEQKRSADNALATKLFEQADKLRKEHPGVGCRKMALELRQNGWGRDRTEHLLLDNGYRIMHRRRYIKTTQSQKLYRFANLIEGMELTNIHQVVQTDTTYYRIKDQFYYLTFFIDVYSRYIAAHCVSRDLKAQANIKALKTLLRNRPYDHTGLIHHSDRGRQYIDEGYLHILKRKGIRISMCNEAWENAYTERINRTIKDEYLDGWNIRSYRQLQRLTAKAVKHYNEKRTHQSLDKQTPKEYELKIAALPQSDRPVLKLHKQQSLL